MKCSQMSASLRAYARLLQEAGCPRCAQDLEALAAAFGRGGEQAVSAVVKKIAKHWKSSGRVAEYPGQLKAELEHIASALSAAGANSAAQDYRSVISLFTGTTGASAHAFAEAAVRSLEVEHIPPEPPAPLNQALIKTFAERLTAARSDNARFDAIVSELRAPRRFSNAALAAIANCYLGAERTYKSRSEILKAITNRQLQDALQASRDRRIAKIAV